MAALPLGETLYAHFSWVPFVSEILMLPPFLYWFYLQIGRKTVFPKGMAFTNILIIRLSFPDWFYKRSDEREHDYLVRDHAGVESMQETGRRKMKGKECGFETEKIGRGLP